MHLNDKNKSRTLFKRDTAPNSIKNSAIQYIPIYTSGKICFEITPADRSFSLK